MLRSLDPHAPCRPTPTDSVSHRNHGEVLLRFDGTKFVVVAQTGLVHLGDVPLPLGESAIVGRDATVQIGGAQLSLR